MKPHARMTLLEAMAVAQLIDVDLRREHTLAKKNIILVCDAIGKGAGISTSIVSAQIFLRETLADI